MVDNPQSALAQRLVPSLLVADMRATLNFYEALGFRIDGIHPERVSATWARMTFGDIALMFYTDPPKGTPTAPVFSGSLTVACADVDALATRWQSLTSFAWGPEKMWYGLYEFAIRDPDGYYIAFVGQVDT